MILEIVENSAIHWLQISLITTRNIKLKLRLCFTQKRNVNVNIYLQDVEDMYCGSNSK